MNRRLYDVLTEGTPTPTHAPLSPRPASRRCVPDCWHRQVQARRLNLIIAVLTVAGLVGAGYLLSLALTWAIR